MKSEIELSLSLSLKYEEENTKFERNINYNKQQIFACFLDFGPNFTLRDTTAEERCRFGTYQRQRGGQSRTPPAVKWNSRAPPLASLTWTPLLQF